MTPPQHAKRIGFVDYRLDNFHADVFLDAFRGPLASRGYEVTGAWALAPEPSRAWASRREARYFDDLSALDEHVDCYMILAPSHPETHLSLCQEVFPKGKPTYVDKTFAPDLATARQIFALADEHGVRVQSSSALRYANVVREIDQLGSPVRQLAVWGGGTSFDEYAIHPLELAVAVMGADAVAVSTLRSGDHRLITIRFADDRAAAIHLNCGAHVPYLAAATSDKETAMFRVDDGRLFVDAAAAVLDFFDGRGAGVDRAETLVIRQILDAAADATRFGSWVWLDATHAASPVPRPHAAERFFDSGRGRPVADRAEELA